MEKDWSGKRIVYELHEQDITLTELSVEAGLAPSTLRNALRMSYPKGERIIAKAIGVKAQEIWPSRYQAKEK